MGLANKYLNISEGKQINEELPRKLDIAIKKIEKKPTAFKAEAFGYLFTELVDTLSETPNGIRILKEFQDVAYETATGGVEDDSELETEMTV